MSSYLTQIAQRTLSEVKGENTNPSPLPPTPNIASGQETDDVFITEVLNQPIIKTEKNEGITKPGKKNIGTIPEKKQTVFEKKTVEKKVSVSTPGYLERQIQRVVPLPPASPKQQRREEIFSESLNKGESRVNLNTLTSSVDRPKKKETPNILNLQKPLDISPLTNETEEKIVKKQPQNIDEQVTKKDVEPKDQNIIPKTVMIVEPKNDNIASSRVLPTTPKLSIGRITVEIVSPSPKVQTEQRVKYRSLAPAEPKMGNKGTNKLIFGLGQM